MPKIKNTHLVAIACSVGFLTATATSNAQDTLPKENENSWVGVVSSDGGTVRCGANESYYPIASLKKGDLILVNGKKHGWYRIETTGDVFNDMNGYIRYPASNASAVLIEGDTGTVQTDLEVLANNTESEELYRSWRPICKLSGGEVVHIVSSQTTDPGTLHREAYVVHTVKMPDSGSGWINTSVVARANDEEISAFYGKPYTKEKDESSSSSPEISAVNVEEDSWGSETNETIVESTEESSETVEQSTTGVDDKPLEPLSLVELEAKWKIITTEPIMGAELSQLLDMYNELLSQNTGDIVVEQVAGGRIKQLVVWAQLQQQKIKIEELKEKMSSQAGEVDELKSVISTYGDYVVVGKLALSNTFDGKLRPLMFRVLDQKSGRTVGYLPVNKDFELSELLGQIVGVTGKSSWNPTWRVNVVKGDRFDILSPTTAIVTPDIQ
jgi:hypothetical protein